MRKKLPKIAESEWRVVQVLWQHGPLTANEMVEKLAGEVTWKPRTVKTLIGRLVKKGAVGFTTEGNRYRYTAAVCESECVHQETRSFVRRVYQGAMKPALAAFLEDADLSPDEIRELQAILEQKRRG
ncbi:MAG: BlaI/MecI/CopY family transcriptional regulator [Sedimentisphaerales bacterium]|nr:BlaI/MecI/CopY family transcriptional regulator [Sedimentisphaerales bacterium]